MLVSILSGETYPTSNESENNLNLYLYNTKVSYDMKALLLPFAGIVTTARLTHATPAALYAHSYSRYYECDTEYDFYPAEPPQGVHDIAYQMVNSAPGNKVKVLLGGGASAFYPQEQKDEIRKSVSSWCVQQDSLLNKGFGNEPIECVTNFPFQQDPDMHSSEFIQSTLKQLCRYEEGKRYNL